MTSSEEPNQRRGERVEVTAIGSLLETLGLPVGIIAILATLVLFLVSHILKNTVPSGVYNRTCEDQKKLEEASAQMSDAIRELAMAHNTTNELIRFLVGRES